MPFVCVGYDTVPGQHPHGEGARRKNLSEEDIITGEKRERERLQVLQHAPGRVSRASPQSNCVYPFVTLRAQRGSDHNNNNNSSSREAIQTNPLVILYRTDPCQVI